MSGQNCCISNRVISSASSSLGICLLSWSPCKNWFMSAFAGIFPSLRRWSKKFFSELLCGKDILAKVFSSFRSCPVEGCAPGYGVRPVYMPNWGRRTSAPQVLLNILTNFLSGSPIILLSRLTWSETRAFIGYMIIVRTPRFFHDSLEFLASVAIFARSGHIKHSVLPEPVPVDTNRFSPLVAASSADIWWANGDRNTPSPSFASCKKYSFIHGSMDAASMPFCTVTYAGDDSIKGFW